MECNALVNSWKGRSTAWQAERVQDTLCNGKRLVVYMVGGQLLRNDAL